MFTIRLFDPAADVLRLLRLFNALEALDGDPNPSTEAHIRSQLAWHGHDPAADRWVAELPGSPDTLIGHAWVFRQTDQRAALKVAVHPEWQRRGIGSALLAHALARVHELGVPAVISGTDARNTAACEFLRQHDFVQVSSNWFMRASADLPLPVPVWPQGYTVCRYPAINNLAALARVLDRGYGDLYGHAQATQRTSESTVAERLAHSWNPENIFLVVAPEGDLVGFCQVKFDGEGDNYCGLDILDAPGIAPEHRRSGLVRPLVLAVMHWQRAHRRGDLLLEAYGDSAENAALYQDLGFVLTEHFIEFERKFAPQH
jgi:mycothiol synthase